MRFSKFGLLIVFSLSALVVPYVEAQLSDEYENWADGPEGFLLTKKESKEWSKITTDADAEHFVELFWARRNPEADNPFNVFKAEFEAKIRYSDENFAYKNHRGAVSDRAKVLILMGRPDNVQRRAGTQSGAALGGTSGGTDVAQGNSEIWIYDTSRLDSKFKTKGPRLAFIFFEENFESNNFILDRGHRESFMGINALSKAPEILLLHPDLDQVPKPVSVAGGQPASGEALAWLEKTDGPLNEVALVLSEEGVGDTVNRPLWVHLELPTGSPSLDLLGGRVTSADGVVLSTFEIEPEPISALDGTAYHLSFSLPPGQYTVEVAGGAAGSLQVVEDLAVEISSIPNEGTWMSPIWLGSSVEQEEEAVLGAPYSFGGWHLTPITGPEVTREAEVAYFGFLVRPGTDEAGAVKLRARMRVKLNGKPIFRPLSISLESSKIFEDLYMYGNALPLRGFPEPGSYEISFRISDENSDVEVERVLTLEVKE